MLLTDAIEARLTSVYVSTPKDSPLVTQLPDVVTKLNIIGFLAGAAGTGNTAPSILVSVNQPDLPMKRAEIKIKDAISTKQPPAALAEAAGKTLTSYACGKLERLRVP